ncbi:putative clathrin assembly protein [Vigna angularis]|uniref:Putative clathrin assembly protein n=1 Tax=Phaseolus angularis TaxID=3914 RepID=A0A8T0L6I7_PHAAN|nr:putative clathrin assembly protein [Vigna angularis]
MGTFRTLRKAYGALKDSTKVGLAKVHSEYKDLDVAIVKATSHVEYPPKERHVAVKTLIVIHRILREGDPTFKEDLINYARRGRFLQISNFKDDSSPQAWDCSAWVRTYALFLEERLECFRILKYDIEAERLSKPSPVITKGHSRTRSLTKEGLLEQLPALQQLLYRLVGCQPEGLAVSSYLIQYALALFFDMPKYDAIKALHVYKRASQQADHLAEFYEYCKRLDLARNFQFPILRQPPASFLATMEEYVKEAPLNASNRLEYHENGQSPKKEAEPKESEETQATEKPDEENKEEEQVHEDEPEPKEEEVELPPLISTDSTDDLLGLNEINPKARELEESNALALAIVPAGGNNSSSLDLAYTNGTSGWELALVTTPSNHTSQAPDRKMAGGFDKLLLDSLYEDEKARRQLQLRNAGYGYGEMDTRNPFNHHNQQDPFAVSNNIAPPTNVQMAFMAQRQQQQLMFQQHQQHNRMMGHYQYPQTQYHQQMPVMGSSNPFEDPLPVPTHAYNSMNHQGNYNLI